MWKLRWEIRVDEDRWLLAFVFWLGRFSFFLLFFPGYLGHVGRWLERQEEIFGESAFFDKQRGGVIDGGNYFSVLCQERDDDGDDHREDNKFTRVQSRVQ